MNIIEWIKGFFGQNKPAVEEPKPAPEPAPYIHDRKSPLGQELHAELGRALADGFADSKEIADYLLSPAARSGLSAELAGKALIAVAREGEGNSNEALVNISEIVQQLRDAEVINGTRDISYNSQLLGNLVARNSSREEGLFKTQ